MAQRKFKPTTPGQRGATVSDFADLTVKKTGKKTKHLISGTARSGGRNNHGRTTVRFRGGGHKRKLRLIDWQRNKIGVPGKVEAIEYDPNRSAHIALIQYIDGEVRYILAPSGLKVGANVLSSDDAEIEPGNCLRMSAMPLGTVVHAIEMKPEKGAQMARSAGTSAQLMAKESGYVLLRLPSGEIRRVLAACRSVVGQLGNEGHENRKVGKAGRSRWLGRRPHNRGVTMNPVDHPHGGGEGRTSGGRHPVTPWGKPTRGKKTRTNKRSSQYIVSRPKKKKRG